MPKEVIGSSDQPFVMTVTWANERDIQLGLGVHREAGAPSLFRQLLVSESQSNDSPGVISHLRVMQLARAITMACERAPVPDHPVGEIAAIGMETLSGTDQVLWDTRGLEILAALERFTHGQCSDIWIQPDRSMLNRLIRTLRRARDAAFGADE